MRRDIAIEEKSSERTMQVMKMQVMTLKVMKLPVTDNASDEFTSNVNAS